MTLCVSWRVPHHLAPVLMSEKIGLTCVLSRMIEMSAVNEVNVVNVEMKEMIHRGDERTRARAVVCLGLELELGPILATVMAVLAD